MPMDELVVFASIAGVGVLALIIGLALILVFRGGRQRCVSCGRKVRRGASYCAACEDELAAGSAQAVGPPASVELLATQGPLTNQRFPISPQGLTIGRHPDNDIVLTSEVMVSRHHAVITLEQGQYVLYDRDSANGIWVNEQRVFRHVLTPGERIRVWQSEFVFDHTGAPPPSPPPPAMAEPGPTVRVDRSEFEDYALEGLIGRGGMSEVYRARAPSGQSVAIKILQQTDPYLVAKFAQEGNKIGPLLRDHPNIIYVHHFGQSADNRLYIVMEYVAADSLRRTLRQQLTEAEILPIMHQVCDALGFAHEKNVVHRDIKPENILVTADGRVKVLDFGIAKLTSAATVTRDKIIGTPEYISPEQARGDPVRPASDVYALGIVLYEMMAGSVPFPRPKNEDPFRAAFEVIRQHLEEKPESITKRNPQADFPRRLRRVAMRALEKEAKKRYDSAREMGKALGYRPVAAPSSLPDTESIAASLVVVQGPRRGHRFPLSERTLTLGRMQLGSQNTAISRQHVSIRRRGGDFWLVDMSKNGTLVDNERVYGEVPLKPGSLIVIGDNVLRLEQG